MSFLPIEEVAPPSTTIMGTPQSLISSSPVAQQIKPHMPPFQPLLDIALLWLAGFRDACCLHRAFIFCKRSRTIFAKTGQCFLLNGCIFLGSFMFLQRVVIPVLNWLLISQLQSYGNHDHNGGQDSLGEGFLGMLQTILISMCYVFWLYPLYLISFVINCIWYNEIAQQAFELMKQKGSVSSLQSMQQRRKSSASYQNEASQDSNGIESTFLGISEQIYSVILLSVFFVEVFAVSFIPFLGQILNFLFLSWLYAYYCFDYKWGFARWNLERRLIFFETNWAFFAGFGSPCVLATYFFSPFVSYGVMAVLFPLFVLVATASQPELAVASWLGGRESASGLKRIPVFYIANILTLPILHILQQGPLFLLPRNRIGKNT